MKKEQQQIRTLLLTLIFVSLAIGGFLLIKKLDNLDNKISRISEQKSFYREASALTADNKSNNINEISKTSDISVKNNNNSGNTSGLASPEANTTKQTTASDKAEKIIHENKIKQETKDKNNNIDSVIVKKNPEKINNIEDSKNETVNEPTLETKDENTNQESDNSETNNDYTITDNAPVATSNYSSSTDNSTNNKTTNKYKTATVTYFWVGEKANRSNDFISNDESYWDGKWLERYGGIDDPWNRCGYYPCSFIPKENPFYFALPYGEFDDDGSLKKNAKAIPWYQDLNNNDELLKNRWLEIVYKDRVCYGQWEDVGPIKTDDYDYVFGDEQPSNQFGAKAGLDVSPAIWDCLGLDSNDIANWRFVKYEDVPPGPWKKIITRSSSSY